MKRDTVIRHCIARFVPSFGEAMRVRQGDVATAMLDPDGHWRLTLNVQDEERRCSLVLRIGLEAIEPVDTKVEQWGLVKLGRNVWTLHRSIHFRGEYHAYVVLVSVPEPAPWEVR